MNRCAPLIAFALSLVLLCGCKGKSESNAHRSGGDSTFVFHHSPGNAVYYWKTVLNVNAYELAFLKKHDVRRMYTRFFDVGVDNLYNGYGVQPVPNATLVFTNSLDSIKSRHVEIVPVVFVTVEALRLGAPLAKRIVRRVDDMCRANHIEYSEMQLDCDWTRETKADFYALCSEVRGVLRGEKKGLSATIRLHQLRDTLPDIDYGVLMLYNTESLQNPSVKNSILSSNAVKAFMRKAASDKHLDFAYPTYEWTLWFKGGKFQGIIRPGESINPQRGGTLRHESSDFKEIIATKRVIRGSLKNIDYPSSIIIYHLDSANLSKYTDNEINEIYSH